MKIILIGFMGSGKSEVARQLAQKLGLALIESDGLVLQLSKRSNINEIFNQDGEVHFRELEIAAAKKLRRADNAVIATGGGAVMNQIIFAYLKSKPKAIIIHLAAMFATVRRRLRHDRTRPLFANAQKARKLYKLREPLYRHYADIVVTTDNRTPASIVKEIIGKLKRL